MFKKEIKKELDLLAEWTTEDVKDIINLEEDVESLEIHLVAALNRITDLERKIKYQQLHNELVNNSLRRLEEDYRRRTDKEVAKGKKRSSNKQNDSSRAKGKKD